MDEDELRRSLDERVTEVRRHFDLSTERVERKLEVVALAFGQFDAKLDRRAASIHRELRR